MNGDYVWKSFDKMFAEAENLLNNAGVMWNMTTAKVKTPTKKNVSNDFDELRQKYDVVKKQLTHLEDHCRNLEVHNAFLLEQLNAKMEEVEESHVIPFIKVAVEKVIAILQLLLKRLP